MKLFDKKYLVACGVYVVGMMSIAIVYAQFELTKDEIFFQECKECVEISRVGVDGRNESGYVIDHGTWKEETYYYGENQEDAKVNFVASL